MYANSSNQSINIMILITINGNDYYYHLLSTALLEPLERPGCSLIRGPSVQVTFRRAHFGELTSRFSAVRESIFAQAWNPQAWHVEGKSLGQRACNLNLQPCSLKLLILPKPQFLLL